MALFQPPPQNLEALVDAEGRPTLSMIGWMNAVNDLLGRGFTGTITTAAITGGGANGSMTFENGVLVLETAAT